MFVSPVICKYLGSGTELENMKSLQLLLFMLVDVALPIRNQISNPDTDPATRILDPVRYLLQYMLIICRVSDPH